MNPLRTVGGRLALALLVVVGGALAIVYLIVVSSYRSSLVNTRLKDMSHTVAPDRREAAQRARRGVSERRVDRGRGARRSPAARRVAIFSAAARSSPSPTRTAAPRVDIEHDPLVRRADAQPGSRVERGRPRRLDLRRGGRRAARRRSVLLRLDARSTATSTSVSVVRRRVLLAAIAATVFAIVLGYGLATLFARRIRRLEAAAERIADGRFDEPVVDPAPGRARPARARLRADAAAARLARPRPRRVHRQRLARAADAALLARRLPRAARHRREPRRRDAGGVPGLDARPGDAADEARDATCSISRGWMPAGSRSPTRASTSAWSARSSRPSSGRAPRAAGHALELLAPDGRPRPWRRGARAPDRPDPDRERRRPHAARHDRLDLGRRRAAARAALVVEDDGPGIPAESHAGRVRPLLPARRRRSPRAAGSASRSRGSSPS